MPTTSIPRTLRSGYRPPQCGGRLFEVGEAAVPGPTRHDRDVTVVLHGARKLDADGRVDDFWLLIDGHTISRTGTGSPPTAGRTIDVAGAWLVPGFIDLHCHGGGGLSFDGGPAAIERALVLHRRHGTTRSVISLVTGPLEETLRQLSEVADLTDRDPLVLGSHLEGPWLAPARRGAHDPTHLRSPDRDEFAAMLAAARGTLRQVTIAPDLPGALDMIDALVAAGVSVAVGHTECDHDLARQAFDRGARLLTHAFNAMAGIHHRAPGPVVAAIEDSRVTIELILDGEHVHPGVAGLLLRAAPGRVCLVTDAMAAAGAGDGDYRLGSLDVAVREGRATLRGTSTLAGSTLTLDRALRNAITRVGVPPVDAIAAVTSVPADALGLGDRLGRLRTGFAADAVLLDDDWTVTAVWAAGRQLAKAT